MQDILTVLGRVIIDSNFAHNTFTSLVNGANDPDPNIVSLSPGGEGSDLYDLLIVNEGYSLTVGDVMEAYRILYNLKKSLDEAGEFTTQDLSTIRSNTFTAEATQEFQPTPEFYTSIGLLCFDDTFRDLLAGDQDDRNSALSLTDLNPNERAKLVSLMAPDSDLLSIFPKVAKASWYVPLYILVDDEAREAPEATDGIPCPLGASKSSDYLHCTGRVVALRAEALRLRWEELLGLFERLQIQSEPKYQDIEDAITKITKEIQALGDYLHIEKYFPPDPVARGAKEALKAPYRY